MVDRYEEEAEEQYYVEDDDVVEDRVHHNFAVLEDDITMLQRTKIEKQINMKQNWAYMIETEVNVKFALVKSIMEQAEEIVREGIGLPDKPDACL